MIGKAINSDVRLVFTSSQQASDRIVRDLTGCPASHVAIGLGEDTLVHAVPRGVVIEPQSAWTARTRGWTVAEYRILPDVTAGLQRVLGNVGEPYDFLFSANYALAYFYRRVVGGPLRALYRELRSGQTCAQLALLLDVDCYRIPEWCDLELDEVLPADLLRRCGNQSFQQLR